MSGKVMKDWLEILDLIPTTSIRAYIKDMDEKLKSENSALAPVINTAIAIALPPLDWTVSSTIDISNVDSMKSLIKDNYSPDKIKELAKGLMDLI